MDSIERELLDYWTKDKENERMNHLGRLLGVMFKAGEVRSWKAAGEATTEAGAGYADDDKVLVPLSFMLRPESREAVQKMVGSDGLAVPKDYKKAEGEVIVDLGKVTPEEFKAFVEKNRVHSLKPEGKG